MKMLLAAAGFALATAGAGFSYVGAATSGSYYYLVTYFSDASRTTVVGYNHQSCNGTTGEVSDNFSGSQTQYSSQSVLGYCAPGGGNPL